VLSQPGRPFVVAVGEALVPAHSRADAMVNRRWRPRAASRLGGPGSRPGRRRASPPTPRTLSSRGLTKPVDSIREEERVSDTVAAVDWEEHEREALGAIEAAATPAQLEDVRVRYLGRKSELAQALRGVRDRESAITRNGLRGRLEAALDARRAELERAELDRALTQEVVDVTLPGEPFPLGHLHPITQTRRQIEDAFLGLGYEIRDDR